MRGLMKLAGIARFDCIGSTQEFTCYRAGLASPQRSHLRLDDQHAAQSPCLAILVPLRMWRLIGNKRHRGSGGWPHPLPAFYRPRSSSAAPDPSRCTRSEGVQCLRIGCTTSSTTSPTAGNSSSQTATVRIGRRHTASTCSPRLRTRGAAPVRERYTTSELV